MRGLEPPPGLTDTDLNYADGVQLRPRVSGLSVLRGFADASDGSFAASVATDRGGRRATIRSWHRHLSESHCARPASLARMSSLSVGAMARCCCDQSMSASQTCSARRKVTCFAMESSPRILSGSRRATMTCPSIRQRRRAHVRAACSLRSRVPSAAARAAAGISRDAPRLHRCSQGESTGVPARFACPSRSGVVECLGDHICP
jgi:hypothetical protein